MSSTVSWNSLGTHLTDTFIVTATSPNATISNFAIIPLGNCYIGDVFLVTYTINSTANQPITVTANDTTNGADAYWTPNSPIQVSLPTNGSSGTLQLKLVITGSGSGSSAVTFVASP